MYRTLRLPTGRPALSLSLALVAFATQGIHGAEAQQLLADIQPQPIGFGTALQRGVASGGKLYFPASGPGIELFVTDGTSAGSGLVLDIRAGAYGSDPDQLTAHANGVWFTADDGVSGRELWFSDGTPAGTRQVRDLFPGSGSSEPRELTVLGSTLIFSCDDGVHGRELWSSDGTTAGTQLMIDLLPGAGSASIEGLVQANGRVVFAATNAQGHREVWASDGTPLGTHPLTNFRNLQQSNPAQFVATTTAAFFVAHDGTHGEELWVSDGTTSGTHLVKDILPGIGRPLINNLVPIGVRVFFAASAPGSGMEPWVSDGTAAGTQLVKDIRTIGFGNSNPSGFSKHGSQIFFAANDDFEERELFVSDGTPQGTSRLDVAPFPESSFPREFASTTNALVFLATTRAAGQELFFSDGTQAGTAMLRDLLPGPGAGVYSMVGELNGEQYFSGFSGTILGGELWATDGTSVGTRFVADLTPTPAGATQGSEPGTGVAIDDRLLLFPATSPNGRELWSTNAKLNGTFEVLDIEAGTGSSDPADLCALDQIALFSAFDSTHGREIWRSDGSAQGTFLLRDVAPGTASSNPQGLVRLGQRVLWLATSPQGIDLWSSDGSPAGTAIIRNLSAIFARGFQVTESGQLAFFVALTPNEGAEIWRTDGTAAGTQLVIDLFPGPSGSLGQIEGGMDAFSRVITDRLIFAADDGVHGNELFVTDGTTAGTSLLSDVIPGAAGSNPRLGASANGVAYFSCEAIGSGRELWRSDGTSAGTTLLHDILPGPGSSLPIEIAALDDVVLFSTFPEVGEPEMWSSSASRALRLRSSTITVRGFQRVADSGVALFSDEDPIHGRELWRTNGSLAPTRLAVDFHVGSADGGAGIIGVLRRSIILTANDGVHGAEPWVIDFARVGAAFLGSIGNACSTQSSLLPVISPNMLAKPGRGAFRIELTQARALTPALLLLAPTTIDVPIGNCRWLVDPGVLTLLAITDANGAASYPLPIPAERQFLGATVFAQAITLDGSGLALSAAVEMLIGD